MKRYKELFSKSPDSLLFLYFNIFFYLSMSLSRTVHSIWFDLNGQLLNYSISYSAMAFSGMFAGILGKRINNFNLSNIIKVGILLYSVGLLLRLFPNSWIVSLLSGLISGIGAATIILLLRTWVVSLGGKEDRAVTISLKRFSSSLGTSIGGILSGVLLYCFLNIFHNFTYPLVLGLASIISLLTFLLVPKIEKQVENDEIEEVDTKNQDSHMKKKIIFFGVMAGLIASLFSPYLPVILKRQSISEVFIGPILTLLSILTIYFSALFSSKKIDVNKQKYYILSELFISIFSLFLIIKLKYYFLIIILIFRIFFVNLSSITQELMELSIYPKTKISHYYGISQTSYFIGDAIGGFVGGWLFNQSMSYSIWLFVVLLVINAILFRIFYIQNSNR